MKVEVKKKIKLQLVKKWIETLYFEKIIFLIFINCDSTNIMVEYKIVIITIYSDSWEENTILWDRIDHWYTININCAKIICDNLADSWTKAFARKRAWNT